MLRRTTARLFARPTRPNLFTENQQKEMNHPYAAGPRFMTEFVPYLPPFTYFGFPGAAVVTVIYILYDKFFGESSIAEHHHSRWEYGMFGKKVSYPANGTSFAYNAPFVGKFGEYNSWKHDKDLHTISPFLEDRIRGQKKHDDHGHHGH